MYTKEQEDGYFLHWTYSGIPLILSLMSQYYLTIRLWARVFYEQIVNEVQTSWLSLIQNEGE